MTSPVCSVHSTQTWCIFAGFDEDEDEVSFSGELVAEYAQLHSQGIHARTYNFTIRMHI